MQPIRGRGRRWSLVVLVAGAMLLSGSPASAATAPPDAWTSEWGGAAKAGVNAGERTLTASRAPALAQAWQFNAGSVRGPAGEYYHGAGVAPAIVGGVIYHPLSPTNLNERGRLEATSARTGARLWSVPLPANAPNTGRSYGIGQTVVGDLVLIPYSGWHQPAGVVAVSISKRAVVWSRSIAGTDGADELALNLVADQWRAYLLAGEGVTAFRLGDGARLWQVRSTTYFTGIAAAGGTLFTTSYRDGLTVWDGPTGARRWTAAGAASGPVVASGRVFASTGAGLAAWNAVGCGKPTCAPLWTTPVPGATETQIGGADGATIFVTATISEDSGPNTGRIWRFSAATGQRQWTGPVLPMSPTRPIRVADTVWIVSGATTLVGWSVNATRPAPLRTLPEPPNAVGLPQGIGAAGGTLVAQVNSGAMTAFRIPGT